MTTADIKNIVTDKNTLASAGVGLGTGLIISGLMGVGTKQTIGITAVTTILGGLIWYTKNPENTTKSASTTTPATSTEGKSNAAGGVNQEGGKNSVSNCVAGCHKKYPRDTKKRSECIKACAKSYRVNICHDIDCCKKNPNAITSGSGQPCSSL